ncbi:leucine-rich repeat-containing G-protein coupled receptor 6-like isoform X2 [Cloeon dipterum]|uniref:leucine-rich repeat-containing G-protein coupled receptor 6-like isoform X2 n=1 Tax=Cloeon dipterum TaxID=197152 RepID=UPI00321F8786
MLRVTLPLLLAATAAVLVSATCPTGCECDDVKLVVTCMAANFSIVPITLNPSIQRLILRQNKIRSVEASIQFYPQLLYFDLSYNHLLNIPNRTFKSQGRLTELHLTKNKITGVSALSFAGLASLVVLNLRGNFIEELGAGSFASLTNLEELDLGQNRLTVVHRDAFKGLTSLSILHLDDNQLLSVPTACFLPLVNLAELRVGLNAFNASVLPDDVFQGLPKLNVLDVSSSNLVAISSHAFAGLPMLRTLSLADNRLESVPKQALSQLTRLEELKIGQNPITTLKNKDFAGLPNLRTLEVVGAEKLERLEQGVFSENKNLENLLLVGNKQLREVESGALTGLPKLRTLVLRDNAFTSFAESMVNWSELRKLDVSENPLVCSCSLVWLQRVLIAREDPAVAAINPDARSLPVAGHAAAANQVLCDSPAQLKDRSLRYLSDEELGCSSKDSTQMAVLGGIIFVVLLVILVVVFTLRRFRRRVRDALKDPPRWFPARSASGAAIARKEHEYQKAQLGCGDEDYMIRAATLAPGNMHHGYGHSLKPIPVTEL